MSLSRAAELLKTADNIGDISFYTFKYENKPPTLNCRIFSVSSYTKDELDKLSDELNQAIQPILTKRREALIAEAKKLLEE